MPPMSPSTRPRHVLPLKVRTSLHKSAGAKRPCSIAATSVAAAQASLSTSTTGRALGSASSTPRSSPLPPVQRLMMLMSGRTATSLFLRVRTRLPRLPFLPAPTFISKMFFFTATKRLVDHFLRRLFACRHVFRVDAEFGADKNMKLVASFNLARTSPIVVNGSRRGGKSVKFSALFRGHRVPIFPLRRAMSTTPPRVEGRR